MEVDFNFTPAEKSELLLIARRSVEAIVSGERYKPDAPLEDRLKQKAGAFVTLHLRGELKGCIGFIEPHTPLYEIVAEMAAKSAVADPRFDSVDEAELEGIEIEISVLSALKPIEKLDEIIVGKHGLMIEKGYFRGLLLPQVATENGWNREQFLNYVCLKAGLGKNAYLDPDSKISIFSAAVFGDEYKEDQEKDIAEGT